MLAPNTTLQGRYRIVRRLGQGGMGTVYEAKALRLNTTVALKETHFTDERLRRQFEREAQLLANLRHPALPHVIDHFDEPDGLYLVMDFVEGDDLWEMLKKRAAPFPVADVISWAGQLLDALQYLHAQSPPAQPSVQPSLTPAQQPSVSPTQEVAGQPVVNGARNANVRTAPVTSTPTPRPVTPTPQPTPQAKGAKRSRRTVTRA